MDIPAQIFQFHDVAEIAVCTDSSFASAFFEAEYGYHSRGEAISRPTLPHAFLDFRETSLVKQAPISYTRHMHKLLARWSYKLSIQPGDIDLRVYGNQAAVSMVHHMLLHPSLRWLAAGSGTLLLHAGAVVKNNKSLIFTGKGGAGKTTTTSLILASGQGWQIHADDYVFLSTRRKKYLSLNRAAAQEDANRTDEAVSLAYVTRSHLYRDLENWVPEIRARLTDWEHIRLAFFGILRKYTREGIKWPVRLSPQRLWPGIPIADTASPAAILLLERADVSSPQLIPVQNLDETANDLLEMNFGEARHFLSLLQKTGVPGMLKHPVNPRATGDPWLAEWKDAERNLLANLLLKIPTYRLVLPLSQIVRGSIPGRADATQASLMLLLDELVK